MATKTEKEVKVKSYRTRSGKRVNPFRRRQKINAQSQKEAVNDKKTPDVKKTLAIGALGVGVTAAATLGLSIGAYKLQTKRYRAGFAKSAEMAEELAKSIDVGKVKQKQQVLLFGIGGSSSVPEVNDGSRIVQSAKRAFSEHKRGDDFKAIPVNNSGANVVAGKERASTGLDFVNDTAAYYKNILKQGRNQSAVDLAANVIAYGDKFPDRPLVMMGHSSGGFAVHEAQEILRIARPDFEDRLLSVSFGTEWWGATQDFGESVTIGSKNDFFTSKLPTKNLKSFDSVKSHGFYDYGTDKDVQDYVKSLIYRKVKKPEANMKKEIKTLNFSRRKPKSAEEKQSISQGLKVYWQKRGKRDAAIAGTGVVALGILSRQQLKKTIADVVRTNVKSTITGDVAEQAGRDFAKGAKEEAAKTFEEAKDKVLGSKTGKFVSEVASTPSRTKQAFDIGLNVKPANENDPSVNRGKALGRVYNRARTDIKKVKSWFGFSQTSQPFFFEPVDSERHPRLIEFAKRKKKPSAKKPLSAAHKAKISAGLQEYYDSIPKKEETIVDKGEKVTKSIGRVARSAKTFAEAANLAANVYERFKKPEVRQGIGAGILGAAAVVSGVAGSFRDVGSATRSLAGAADIVHDLATGSKKKRQKYREDVLQAKREANKTNRQVHAVRAKLERRKMEQKKEDQRLKGITSEAYEKLVDTTARIKPFEIAAALQRAATGAKDKEIKKGDDYWFMPEETIKVKK
jgi:hypothetical protein